jgi:NAD(P)-dependent dehydrogenase (short-subunit alcohol dehydrogenase family)
MADTLDGKVVAVTGAFGSLGAAVVQAVRAAGAMVAAIDKLDQAQAPVYAAGVKAWGGVDLGVATETDAAFKAIADTFGGVDALVNVAGGFRYETFSDGSIETWDLLYRINLRTTLTATRSALPHILKRAAGRSGRVVSIGAVAAVNASSGMGAYAASKAGVVKLTESLAAELKDLDVTVNAVLPSILDTPTNRLDMPNADFTRWVTPDNVADLIIFLLSAKSKAISGACIPIVGRV